jgi:hypothetical protein
MFWLSVQINLRLKEAQHHEQELDPYLPSHPESKYFPCTVIQVQIFHINPHFAFTMKEAKFLVKPNEGQYISEDEFTTADRKQMIEPVRARKVTKERVRAEKRDKITRPHHP